jgi:hypothetical protein
MKTVLSFVAAGLFAIVVIIGIASFRQPVPAAPSITKSRANEAIMFEAGYYVGILDNGLSDDQWIKSAASALNQGDTDKYRALIFEKLNQDRDKL